MLKKEKKHVSGDATTISTLLGRDTVIEGTLAFKETIRVDGRVSGKLVSEKGTLIVGENAVLDADIQVGVAIVRGRINGRLEASQRIEIHAPAQVNGDISAPSVAIASGVVFNGNCAMQAHSPQSQETTVSETRSLAGGPVDQKVSKKL
jgi:cytoskeletal protein CcmA (bactofilin family)